MDFARKLPRKLLPDLDAVKYEITENGAVFTPNPETQNGVQKQLEIKMDPDDANMQVTMRVKNIGTVSKDLLYGALPYQQNTAHLLYL